MIPKTQKILFIILFILTTTEKRLYRGSYGDTRAEKSEKDESAENQSYNGYNQANYAYTRFYFFNIILFFVFHSHRLFFLLPKSQRKGAVIILNINFISLSNGGHIKIKTTTRRIAAKATRIYLSHSCISCHQFDHHSSFTP